MLANVSLLYRRYELRNTYNVISHVARGRAPGRNHRVIRQTNYNARSVSVCMSRKLHPTTQTPGVADIGDRLFWSHPE